MCEAKDFPPSERDELMGLVTQLQWQVAQLTAAKEELHKQVAELKRAGKRQAALFSKGGRSSRPKRPGRKPGMGSFSYRKSPSPDEVAEPLVEVAVAEDTWPGCGGRLEHEGVRVVYETDIPPIPRPQVTGYRVQICRCRSCGKQVRGRHPDMRAEIDALVASACGLAVDELRFTFTDFTENAVSPAYRRQVLEKFDGL